MKTKEGQSPRENARARRTFPQQFLYSNNSTRNAVLKHSWVDVVALACLIKMHVTSIWLGCKPRELPYNPMITSAHESASSGNPSRSFQTKASMKSTRYNHFLTYLQYICMQNWFWICSICIWDTSPTPKGNNSKNLQGNVLCFPILCSYFIL